MSFRFSLRPLWVFLLLGLITASAHAQDKRPVTFTDLMQFRTVQHASLSDDGQWIAFTANADRGNGAAVVRHAERDVTYQVALGSHPTISADGQYVAMRLNPSFAALAEARDAKPADKPKRGMILLNTASGDTTHIPQVDAFAFSVDGAWLAFHHFEGYASTDSTDGDTKRKAGSRLVLYHLASSTQHVVPYAKNMAFDEQGHFFAYSVMAPDSTEDGLYVRGLRQTEAPIQTLHAQPFGHYTEVTWHKTSDRLAFLVGTMDDDGEVSDAALWLWNDGEANEAVAATEAPTGWILPATNNVRWTDDGKRVFFGFRPTMPDKDEAEDAEPVTDPYDMDAILADRTVDVWHWNDSLIYTQQKRQWSSSRNWTYDAVYHVDRDRMVRLTTKAIRGMSAPQNERVMLARSQAPYMKEITWEGSFYDYYVVDLATGTPTMLGERLGSTVSLSPSGRYVTLYDDEHWHLYDVTTGTTRNLTADLDVPFGNEDHDYPSDVPGYGIAGWVVDEAVLIYDKFDIWRFPTDGGTPERQTHGREDDVTFRVVTTDPDKRYLEDGDEVLLMRYHNYAKSYGYAAHTVGRAGTTQLIHEPKRFRFVAKAKDADRYLYSREDYSEFPDLWVSDSAFREPRKRTEVNPQMAELAWGTSELVDWLNVDGIPMQGVVIKPPNYDPNRQYPVLIYFYRFFSQRVHEFNAPLVNHRPSFPVYSSDDYLIFLPDVRFEVGRPGFAATKSVVPGVQRIIELGYADPDAIGLHGHSWSGYQTAFIVTQTDIFKAAIAGAPVSNMTSAYGGIRWGSGRARQFQYEKTQSRLGASLWEARDHYIDNSPLFFADQINTPLLIIHGDEDGAVPWEQSIELYLALRRLGKDTVFLQYRGADHHPATYANKLDWSIKMKEYLDYYLKGAQPAAWITNGQPYRGD